MARTKKTTTQVASIRHKDKRANIPTEELRDFVADEELAPKTMLYFLDRGRGGMKYLKLMKLLYLADRESMKRHGHPISGDRYVSMEHARPVRSGARCRARSQSRNKG